MIGFNFLMNLVEAHKKARTRLRRNFVMGWISAGEFCRKRAALDDAFVRREIMILERMAEL